jgi:antirestriction protein ArdC
MRWILASVVLLLGSAMLDPVLRLRRDERASHDYSQEELCAEMGAAFLLAEAGIDAEGMMDNSAAYVASWLKALRNDKKLVVFAGAHTATEPPVDRVPVNTAEYGNLGWPK